MPGVSMGVALTALCSVVLLYIIEIEQTESESVTAEICSGWN